MYDGDAALPRDYARECVHGRVRVNARANVHVHVHHHGDYDDLNFPLLHHLRLTTLQKLRVVILNQSLLGLTTLQKLPVVIPILNITIPVCLVILLYHANFSK